MKDSRYAYDSAGFIVDANSVNYASGQFFCLCPERHRMHLSKPSGIEGKRPFASYFAHNGSESAEGTCGMHCGESAEHKEAKEKLKQWVGRYSVLLSECSQCSCVLKTLEVVGRIELEVRNENGRWRYDCCLFQEDNLIAILEVVKSSKCKLEKVHDAISNGVTIVEIPVQEVLEMQEGAILSNTLANTSASCSQCTPAAKRTKRESIVSSLPVSKEYIESVLAKVGDKVSKVGDITFLEDRWEIQCDRQGQPRICLVGHQTDHNDSDCKLCLYQRTENSYCLDYSCMSEKCKNKQARHLCAYVAQEDGNFEKYQYDAVKFEFEKNSFRIDDPFSYATETNNKLIRLNQGEFKQFFNTLHYYERDGKGTNWKKKLFIDAWLNDNNKRTVNTLEVDPTGTQKGVYNLWRGYLAGKLPRSLSYAGQTFPDEEAAKQFAAAPVIKHFTDVVASGCREHTDFLLDWLAIIVQRPEMRTHVAILIQGEQGTGKGIIFDWIRKSVLGPQHTYMTDAPDLDLFSRFSDGLVNKTLVQIDEVKSLHNYTDRLKHAITGDTIRMEMKGVKPTNVKALANFVMTSNNESPLKVTTDDRRLVLFKCASVYKGNSNYFNELGRHMDTPGVDAWFYKFLADRDISSYTHPSRLQEKRPITDFYKKCQSETIPQLSLYLSSFINSDTVDKISASDFRDGFIAWTKKLLLSIEISACRLGKEIAEINKKDGGITIVKTNKCQVYVFDKFKLKTYLVVNNQYEESAMI